MGRKKKQPATNPMPELKPATNKRTCVACGLVGDPTTIVDDLCDLCWKAKVNVNPALATCDAIACDKRAVVFVGENVTSVGRPARWCLDHDPGKAKTTKSSSKDKHVCDEAGCGKPATVAALKRWWCAEHDPWSVDGYGEGDWSGYLKPGTTKIGGGPATQPPIYTGSTGSSTTPSCHSGIVKIPLDVPGLILVAGAKSSLECWKPKQSSFKPIVLNVSDGSFKTTSIRVQGAIDSILTSMLARHSSAVSVISIDWPDMGVPAVEDEFWADFGSYIKATAAKAAKKKEMFSVGVCCQMGHGRTGTALSILVWSIMGTKLGHPVKWVRSHYCAKAVESAKQTDYIHNITGISMKGVKGSNVGTTGKSYSGVGEKDAQGKQDTRVKWKDPNGKHMEEWSFPHSLIRDGANNVVEWRDTNAHHDMIWSPTENKYVVKPPTPPANDIKIGEILQVGVDDEGNRLRIAGTVYETGAEICQYTTNDVMCSCSQIVESQTTGRIFCDAENRYIYESYDELLDVLMIEYGISDTTFIEERKPLEDPKPPEPPTPGVTPTSTLANLATATKPNDQCDFCDEPWTNGFTEGATYVHSCLAHKNPDDRPVKIYDTYKGRTIVTTRLLASEFDARPDKSFSFTRWLSAFVEGLFEDGKIKPTVDKKTSDDTKAAIAQVLDGANSVSDVKSNVTALPPSAWDVCQCGSYRKSHPVPSACQEFRTRATSDDDPIVCDGCKGTNTSRAKTQNHPVNYWCCDCVNWGDKIVEKIKQRICVRQTCIGLATDGLFCFLHVSTTPTTVAPVKDWNVTTGRTNDKKPIITVKTWNDMDRCAKCNSMRGMHNLVHPNICKGFVETKSKRSH